MVLPRKFRFRNRSSAHLPTRRTPIMKATSSAKRPTLRVGMFQEGTSSVAVASIPNTLGISRSSRCLLCVSEPNVARAARDKYAARSVMKRDIRHM